MAEIDDIRGQITALQNQLDELAMSMKKEADPGIGLLWGAIETNKQKNERLEAEVTRMAIEEDDKHDDQIPGVEDDERTAYAECTTCDTLWDPNAVNDPNTEGEPKWCENWQFYQPNEYLDITVCEYPYWSDDYCIRYVYWKLRFRAGKLICAIRGSKGDCQDGCVVCATDCVELADPECA